MPLLIATQHHTTAARRPPSTADRRPPTGAGVLEMMSLRLRAELCALSPAVARADSPTPPACPLPLQCFKPQPATPSDVCATPGTGSSITPPGRTIEIHLPVLCDRSNAHRQPPWSLAVPAAMARPAAAGADWPLFVARLRRFALDLNPLTR